MHAHTALISNTFECMLCNTVCMFPGIGQKSTLKSLKEGRDAKQVTHIHLAFLFKTFFITMVQRNRMQTENRSLSWWEKGKKKTEIKVRIAKAVGSRLLQRRDLQKISHEHLQNKTKQKNHLCSLDESHLHTYRVKLWKT